MPEPLANLKSLLVMPENPSAVVSDQIQFSATGVYSDASTLDVTTLAVWSSSNPAVANIDVNGLAYAQASGSTEIQATYLGFTDSSVLSVAVTLVSIAVTPAELSLLLGATQQYTATGTYSDAGTQDLTQSVAWISDQTVATVDESGLAHCIGAGTSAIVARTETLLGNATLIVSATIKALMIGPRNNHIAVGATLQFEAAVTYNDNSYQNVTAEAAWSSSDPTIVTINSAGVATGIAGGSVTIRANYNNVAASTGLTIIAIDSPCDQYRLAQAQLLRLISGTATVAIETPQLGRVEYGQANVTDLQRLVDRLAGQCAQSQGLQMARRRPISIEAWP